MNEPLDDLRVIERGQDAHRERMLGLDGLRGLLVPIVLTYHLGVAGFGGFLALEGFFVLSGFLITLLLLDRPPQHARDLGQWWLRRWRRLVPAVVVVVSVTVVVFRNLQGIAHDAVSTLTWWRNWDMVYGATTYWSRSPSPLKHAWSLSVEEQFYLVFPILLIGVLWFAGRSRWAPSGVVIAVCGALTTVGYGWQIWLGSHTADLNRVYLGSDTRGASIMLGCVAGALAHRSTDRGERASRSSTTLGIVGLGVIVVLGFVLGIEDRRTYQGGLVLASLAWVAVTAAASRPGPVGAALSIRPLRWMGIRSYGIYLWSWPVQVFVATHWPTLSLPALAAVTLPVAFTLAAISHRLVERPLLLRSGWAAVPTARRLVWAGGISMAIIATVLVGATAPAPDALSAMTEQSTADDAMASVKALRPAGGSTSTSASTATTTSTPSSSGVPTGPTPTAPTAPAPTAPAPTTPRLSDVGPFTVLVGGDSQAATAAGGVKRSELPDYIGAVANAGVLGCGVLIRTEGWMVDNPVRGGLVDGSYCRAKGTAEDAEIVGLSAHPAWLVITSGGYEQSHSYRAPDGRMLPPEDPEIRQGVQDALDLRIRRANAQGTRVALLEFACPGRVEGEPGWDEFTRASIEWHNSNLREVAAAHPGTITIPASAQVCVDGDAAGQPTPAKAAAWGSVDRVHVTDRGQAWVWKVQIGPALWAASIQQR